MTFAIVCPTCRVKSRVPERLRGKRVRCLKCQARFVVLDPVPVRANAAGGKGSTLRPPSGSLSARLPVILAAVSTGALLIVLFLFLKELSTPAVGSGGWLSGTFAEMGKRLRLF